MSTYRILYLRAGLLDGAEEVVSDDLVTVTKVASSKRPDMTAEIWLDGRKVVVVGPSGEHRLKHQTIALGRLRDGNSRR